MRRNHQGPVSVYKRRLNPFTAWMAFINCSLIFCLAPTMLYAQTTTEQQQQEQEHHNVGTFPSSPGIDSCRQACYSTRNDCAKTAGDDSAAVDKCNGAAKECMGKCAPPQQTAPINKPHPEISTCAQACYSTRNECAKTAGDDKTALNQCNGAAKECMGKCAPFHPENGGDKPHPEISACVQTCYSTRMDCAKTAGDNNSVALHKCNEAAMACMTSCKGATDNSPMSVRKAARQAQLAAIQSAQQAYHDGLKKLHDDYLAALKKAKDDYNAAMAAAGQSPTK